MRLLSSERALMVCCYALALMLNVVRQTRRVEIQATIVPAGLLSGRRLSFRPLILRIIEISVKFYFD